MEQFPREHNRRSEIDTLAKKGHFAENDLPATDTYDDGLNHEGKLIMPGSTSTEAGGTYMEDQGPQDAVRRDEEEDSVDKKDGTSVIGINDLKKKNSIYVRNDKDLADKFLRENDPNHPDYKKAA